MKNAETDRALAEEVKIATSALNRAINKASNQGLVVVLTTIETRSVTDPAPIPVVQVVVSRPL